MQAPGNLVAACGEIYEFRVRGELAPDWSEWFDGLEVCSEDGETVLRGPVGDQSALYGLIAKFRNLGLVLVSVDSRQAGRTDRC